MQPRPKIMPDQGSGFPQDEDPATELNSILTPGIPRPHVTLVATIA